MPFWKRLLLNLYYHGTYPVRVCNYWREVSRGHLPIIVLCYHRISDDGLNSWTTSNRLFTQQIRWLAKRFRFISLEETQRRIRSGENHEPCVSITFDDGYADNCRSALPWLLKENIPCTYFVTLHNVLTQESFVHDLAAGHHVLPNTIAQLEKMAEAGIEVAIHAYTHSDLGAVADARILGHEVVAAGKDLEAIINRPVRYFAFPYGLYANLNSTVFEIARQAGYEAVCSAYGGFNYPGDDPFHLQRIVVDNDMIHLKNWATMDPRKMRMPKFQYRREASGPKSPISQSGEQTIETRGKAIDLEQSPGTISIEQFTLF
jgi:peptidoglycan/xylan/chitin deacetylase (PgdA/CDA1 family)